MKTEILFASEGFKLTRGPEGYGEVPEHLRAEELFTQAGGRACFQIVMRGEEGAFHGKAAVVFRKGTPPARAAGDHRAGRKGGKLDRRAA